MADDRRLVLQGRDDLGDVVSDLPDALAGEDLRVGPGLGNGARIIRPAGGDGGVAVVLEERPPRLPARGEHPQSVNEDDGQEAGGVRPAGLLRLADGEAHWCTAIRGKGPAAGADGRRMTGVTGCLALVHRCRQPAGSRCSGRHGIRAQIVPANNPPTAAR